MCISSASANLNNRARIISAQEETDLDLFSSNNNRSSVFSKLDRTETSCGKAALKDILRNPLLTIEDLTQRQDAIKELVTGSTLFEEINNELVQFRTGEAELHSFQEPEDPIRKAALDEFFFKSKLLKKYNKSSAALNVGQMLHMINLSFPLLEHLVLHFLISNAVKKKYNIGCCGSDHEHGHKSHKHHAPPATTTVALYKAYNLVHLLIHCLGVKELIGHVYQKVNLIKELQKKLIAASACIKSLKKMHNIIAPHQIIHTSLPSYRHLEKLFLRNTDNQTDSDVSEKFAQLCTLLSRNTFTGAASCLSNYGAILSANTMLKEVQQELSEGLKAFGEIDAYMSIAKLYKQSQDSELKYSYANYITNPELKAPAVDVEGSWNPLMTTPVVNLEHFDLGITNPAHIIITGPNAAGKSTKLKSMTLLILLGQTITIVPATSFKFTPFAKISTFIQHADNLNTGDSLFTNEVNKANSLVSYLKNLPENEFCFIVFDELFTSTAFEYGQESAIKLMDYISNFKNTVSITATHFPLLTTLADTKPQDFKNFNAQVLKDEAGKLNFLFKEGISNEKEAFKVLGMRNIGFDWNS